jgi:hypothetical protein
MSVTPNWGEIGTSSRAVGQFLVQNLFWFKSVCFKVFLFEGNVGILLNSDVALQFYTTVEATYCIH